MNWWYFWKSFVITFIAMIAVLAAVLYYGKDQPIWTAVGNAYGFVLIAMALWPASLAVLALVSTIIGLTYGRYKFLMRNW